MSKNYFFLFLKKEIKKSSICNRMIYTGQRRRRKSLVFIVLAKLMHFFATKIYKKLVERRL